MLTVHKYLIQPVLVERDEEGRTVGEMPGQTFHAFDAAGAAEAIAKYEQSLAEWNIQQNGGIAMPVDETTVTRISCDNPGCPGNELDPAERTGWLFVSHEVYGQPTAQNVFCSTACVSQAAGTTVDPARLFSTEPAPEPAA